MVTSKKIFLIVLSLITPILWISSAYSACSPYLGDMVINEAYGEGPYSSPFVETRLMDSAVAGLIPLWSVRVCQKQGNKDVCLDSSFSTADLVEYAATGNPYFMFYPGNQMMDLNGIDITIRDENGYVIDYLSVNGYVHQKGACSTVDNNAVTIGPGIKGAERLPDGTGGWVSYEKTGANSGPTPDYSNDGSLTQVDHYRIYHPAEALTCQAASVSVQACMDATCTNKYAGSSTVTISAPGGVWVGSNTTTFTGGTSGSLLLRKNAQGNVTLGIASASPASSSYSCYTGNVASDCSITFRDSGFVFDVAALTSCQNSTALTIQAVRKDASSQLCVGDSSFANQTDRPVNFSTAYITPNSPQKSLIVNGVALPLSGAATVLLDFDSSALSTLSVRYNDAGKLGLTAAYSGTGVETGLSMTGSSPEFVVSPHHLRVRATTDGSTLLNNATPNGDPHWPAGEDFEVEVAGVCADGTVTPNFSASTDLDATAGNPAAGVVTGGPFAAGDYSAGVVNGTASYSEVGTFTLQAQAANYLGSGIDVTGSTTAGRFTPHHFTATPNSPLFATACSVGGFTYVGQAFDYALAPAIMVTAQNKQGGTTANYTGTWWKMTNASLSDKTYSAAKGTLDLTNIPAVDPVISDSGGGKGVLTFDAGSGLSFARGVPVAPFDADISLSINVLDTDGIAATANPVTFGAATAGNGISFDHGKAMRWGRVSLKNAYGSELLPLSMPLRAEYFDGTSFVKNTGDGCTALALTQLELKSGTTTVTGDQPVAVGSGSSQASLGHIPMLAGDAGLTFSAPGSNGYIQVRTDLTLLPWLRYDWDGDGSHDDSPSARASFGIYKGRPGMIYMRESFR
jgi:MSHA biogenesis protein MshQ